MGLFSNVTKGIRSAVKGVQKGIKQIPQEARNAVNSAVRFQGSVIQGVASSATSVVQGVGQVAGAATEVLNDNPLLGQALGGMVPGLGGLFSGGGATTQEAYAPPADTPAPSKVPMWVWIAAGGAALVGLLLILKRKKAS